MFILRLNIWLFLSNNMFLRARAMMFIINIFWATKEISEYNIVHVYISCAVLMCEKGNMLSDGTSAA